MVYTRRGPAFLITEAQLNKEAVNVYRGPLIIPYTDIHSEGVYARNPRIPLIHAWVEEMSSDSSLDYEQREEEFYEINKKKINFMPFMEIINNKVAFLAISNKGEFKDGNIAFYEDRVFVREDNKWKEAEGNY